jgi:hypothetical protein
MAKDLHSTRKTHWSAEIHKGIEHHFAPNDVPRAVKKAPVGHKANIVYPSKNESIDGHGLRYKSGKPTVELVADGKPRKAGDRAGYAAARKVFGVQ